MASFWSLVLCFGDSQGRGPGDGKRGKGREERKEKEREGKGNGVEEEWQEGKEAGRIPEGLRQGPGMATSGTGAPSRVAREPDGLLGYRY